MSLRKSAALAALLAAASLLPQPAPAAGGDRPTIRPAIYHSVAGKDSAPVQLVRYGYRGYGGYGYRGYGGYRPYYGYRGYYGGGFYSPFGYGLGLGYGLGYSGYGYGYPSIYGYGYPGVYGGVPYSYPSYGGYGITYGVTPSVGIW
jgi:hypothetical protein